MLVAGPALAQTTPPPGQAKPPVHTPPAEPQTPAKPTAPVVPFPEGSKIAIVNFQTVASESTIGKAATAKLNTLKDQENTKLQKENQDLQDLMKKQQTGLLSTTAQQDTQAQIEKLQMQIQYDQQVAQKETGDLNDSLMNDFMNKAIPIVQAIAKEKGIEVVLSVADAGVVYWRDGLDISAEVVKRLDAAGKN